MAQNIKPAAKKPDDPVAPKKSGNKLLVGVIVSLSVIIASGAAWYFTKGKGDTAHVEEVKVAPPKPPIFIALEPFTVNLQRESSDQYLQLGLSLKLFEVENEEKIKLNLPEIRSKILQLLTTKTATELLTAEGKSKLVKEILTLSNAVIGVIDAPAPATVAHKPTQIAAASQVEPAAEEKINADAIAVSAPAATPHPTAQVKTEKKGIVDVLFTSFIIQ
jgi:flagellar FliL protein